MKLVLTLIVVAAVAAGAAGKQQASDNALPLWLTKLMENGRSAPPSVEQARYEGRTVYVVMPRDRAPDSGNENVLYSENGQVICEFGGLAGHVTAGSCDTAAIMFVRTVANHPAR